MCACVCVRARCADACWGAVQARCASVLLPACASLTACAPNRNHNPVPFPRQNDEVYDAIDRESVQYKAAAAAAGAVVGEKLDLDRERRVRGHADMAAEAAELRQLFA